MAYTPTIPEEPSRPEAPSRETERRLMGALAAALAEAQAEFEPVTRSKTVTVRTDKGPYTFSYAPLDVIFSAVRAPLAKHGLAVTQLLLGKDLITRLMHVEGGYLESVLAVPQSDRVQQLGSAITYLRRYALQAMLGIAAEEDDDGNAQDGNAMEKPRVGEEMMPRRRERKDGVSAAVGTAGTGDAVPSGGGGVSSGQRISASSPADPVCSFEINGAPYTTKGITKDQLLASFPLVKAVDAKHGKNYAMQVLMREFGVMTRSDLDAEAADKFLVRLRELTA